MRKFFFYLSGGMENCKMSGKKQGTVRDLEVDDKWQPCQHISDRLMLPDISEAFI